jgi:hypothetical protein
MPEQNERMADLPIQLSFFKKLEQYQELRHAQREDW